MWYKTHVMTTLQTDRPAGTPFFRYLPDTDDYAREGGSLLCPPFVPMARVIPDGGANDWRVERFTLSRDAAAFESLQALHHGDRAAGRFTRAGTYLRLIHGAAPGGTCVMSDTGMERYTNLGAVERACGDVLVAGLGLGMVLVPLLVKAGVRRVVVVEQAPDVVSLVLVPLLDFLPPYFSAKLEVRVGSIFDRDEVVARDERFNAIYFDIWNEISGTHYPAMKQLHALYRSRLDQSDPHAWMDSWRRDDMRRHHFDR